jgi:hypothetical protein
MSYFSLDRRTNFRQYTIGSSPGAGPKRPGEIMRRTVGDGWQQGSQKEFAIGIAWSVEIHQVIGRDWRIR